jgi:hypothetical protein
MRLDSGAPVFVFNSGIQGMSATNVCYYSNKCQWSKAFVTELSKTPWKNSFRFICVDPSPTRPQLPGWLKKVPTIVVAGESEPRTDSDVMNWLYEKRMKEGQQQGAPPASGEAGGEPEAFSVMEQVSFAKGFSYSGLDVDTTSQGSGGNSMPGAFSFLNGAAAEGDKSGQSISASANQVASQRRSKKEELFDKQMEAYQRDREQGMPRQPTGRL